MPEYALGHSELELRRLAEQAKVIEPITRQFLVEAGIGSGMRVLDVGTAIGDVAFLAAELVGPTGQVVGADRADIALSVARQRADAQSIRNVSFCQGEIDSLAFDRPFDAVIGRYILQFQPDPADTLAKLARLARPGGVVVFQEPDFFGYQSQPPAPTFDLACQWVLENGLKHGVKMGTGPNLYAVFLGAGLAPPTVRLSAAVGAGTNASAVIDMVAAAVGARMQAIEESGIATSAEIRIDSLAERIKNEVIANKSTVRWRLEYGAWSRIS